MSAHLSRNQFMLLHSNVSSAPQTWLGGQRAGFAALLEQAAYSSGGNAKALGSLNLRGAFIDCGHNPLAQIKGKCFHAPQLNSKTTHLKNALMPLDHTFENINNLIAHGRF